LGFTSARSNKGGGEKRFDGAAILSSTGLGNSSARGGDRVFFTAQPQTLERLLTQCQLLHIKIGEISYISGVLGTIENQLRTRPASPRKTRNCAAGQSFGAFLARGITLDLVGEANDYVDEFWMGSSVLPG
jgi:hypothetical protein